MTKLAPSAAVLALVVLAACGSSAKTAGPVPPPTASTAPASPTTAPVAEPTTMSSVTPACLAPSAIDAWTPARRAAQLVVLPVLDFNVSALTASVRAGAGGVLFLGNATTPSDLHQQLAALTAGPGPGAAPLVMADVEGGGVQRMPGAVAAFPWARDIAATQSVGQAQSLGRTVGQQMLAAGANVDLAPVVDLDNRPGPSTTNPDGLRSFSIDPSVASAYGIAFMQGLRAAGVLSVVKHFPGLGGTTENTDYGPAATLPLAQLQTGGLRPFVNAIAAHAPAIMVSNAYVPGLTTEPSSVSPAVVQGLLRTQLGFSGLVVTDSLSAGALTAAGYSVPQAAVASIEAGTDMVLFGSTLTPADTALLSPANVEASREAIVNALVGALQSGALTSARLDNAVTHVLTAKGVAICSA